MNYRHAFHAGNFADVHKHTALVCILQHLRDKPSAFRVIDTHAGAGRYNLSGEEAEKTGEWRAGIGRLWARPIAEPAAALLAPYLAIASPPAASETAVYPGSPLIVRQLLRPADRLIACEAEPNAARKLDAALARDARCKAIAIDGWTGLSAYIPPRERRGLVLVDPPFEEPDEFKRLAGAMAAAWRKWPSGIYMLWYPVKDRTAASHMARQLQDETDAAILRSELFVAAPGRDERLAGSGVIVINPPWRLHDQLTVIGPALSRALATQDGARASLDWVRAPR
jgi:23S rRNA (adenine2030-N6)-methyltransferase